MDGQGGMRGAGLAVGEVKRVVVGGWRGRGRGERGGAGRERRKEPKWPGVEDTSR